MRDLSGNLLAGALINVTDGRKVIKSASQGDFWRLLNPGTYKIEVSLPGAPGRVLKTVKVEAGPSRVDFVLELKDGTSYAHNAKKTASPSGPGAVAITLLSVSAVLTIVLVAIVLYYRRARKEYEHT